MGKLFSLEITSISDVVLSQIIPKCLWGHSNQEPSSCPFFFLPADGLPKKLNTR